MRSVQVEDAKKAKATAKGLRSKAKVMIGGAPITQQYADEIGADGYADNASAAVTTARQLAGAT